MNKEFKQWKALLARKEVLLPIGVVGFVLLFPILIGLDNFLSYLFDWFVSSLSALKQGQALTSFSPPFSWSFFFILQHKNMLHLSILFILLVVIIWKIGWMVYKVRRAYEDLNKGSKGTQQFATIEEIIQQYPCARMDDKEFDGPSGVPIVCYKGYIYFDPANTNSEAVGSTQSGKTQGHTYPMMDLGMRAKIKDSFLIFDVKGNMIRNTKAEWERFGYDVFCLNLINPDNGISYNPLELIRIAYQEKDFGKAQMLAQTFSYSIYNDPQSKDKFWQDTSIALMNALILAVCDIAIKNNRLEYVTLYSVAVMLSTLSANPDENGKTALDLYFEALPADNPARMQFSVIEKSTGVTRGGIYTNAHSKLAPFMNDKIAKMTARSTINLADLGYGKKPIALFMVVPDYDESNYALISTFISQVNYVLAEKATSSASGKLKRRVRRLFEEIANVPAIEGLSRAMNVDLERGLLTHIVLQSHAQLIDKYGENLAEAITGACGNKFYIMSDNFKDAAEFSELVGDKTIIAPNRHGDPLSLDKSFGEQEDGRRLLDANEIRSIHEGEWVVVRSKKRKNLKGEHIKPKPIFANRAEGTNMLFAYEYLGDRFKSELALEEYQLSDGHESIDLKSLIIPFKTNEVDAEEPYLEEYETYEYNNSSNVPENYEENEFFIKENGGIQGMSEQIEAVEEKQTLLSEILNQNKQNVLKQLAQKELDEEEYLYFTGLKTVEEVKSFLSSSHDREKLKNNIETFVFS